MLQETKKTSNQSAMPQYSLEKQEQSLNFFSLIYAQWGGMLITCNSDFFKLQVVEYGSSSLSAKLLDNSSGSSCWISCIYGPASSDGGVLVGIE